MRGTVCAHAARSAARRGAGGSAPIGLGTPRARNTESTAKRLDRNSSDYQFFWLGLRKSTFPVPDAIVWSLSKSIRVGLQRQGGSASESFIGVSRQSEPKVRGDGARAPSTGSSERTGEWSERDGR